MTTRDRLMLIGLLALAILVGGYLMAVAPERQKASKLSGEAQAARQQLQSVETQAAEATSARSRYAAAYASLVSLGPAVPASGETPSLVYALASATDSRHVDFESITSGGTSGTGSATSRSAGASSASGAPAASASTFAQEPFSFDFQGSYEDLYKLIAQLEGFTDQTGSGALKVNGRLLTIDGIQLADGESGTSSGASGGGSNGLKVTVTATAYVLPPGQSALGGATPSGPAGATPAGSGSSTSSPTSAAVIKGGP